MAGRLHQRDGARRLAGQCQEVSRVPWLFGVFGTSAALVEAFAISWICLVDCIGKAATLRVPELLASTCIFIKEKFIKRLRKVPCGLKQLELGELFRTDAKCEPGRVVLGGWLIGSRADPSDSSWFSMALTPSETPWLFRGPDLESSWSSTVALKIFGINKSFKHLAASHVVRCGGGTDNKAASAVTNRGLSTKLPLMIILMEYLGTREEIGLRCHLDWRPRDTNTEADDLTNGRFHAFQASKRIPVSWSDLDLPYIRILMRHSETFSKRRPSDSLQHMSEGRFQKSKWGRNNSLCWGSFCVVSAVMFALLRAFDLIGAWSQTQKCHVASIQPSTKNAVLSRRVALVVL